MTQSATLQSAAAATGNGFGLDARDYDTITAQISGTFVGTITWEISSDYSTWAGVLATKVSDGVAALTATGTGNFTIPGGFYLRARVSAYTSGTITVSAEASDGAFGSLGVLGAGTNAIGKLASNTGVDIGDVDVTSIVPGTGATNLGKAEDAAAASGDVGVMALAVRANTPAATGADGDYVPLLVNTDGRLHAVLASEKAEDSAHTTADTGVAVLAVQKAAHAALASDGDYANPQLDAKGFLKAVTGKLVRNVSTVVTFTDTLARATGDYCGTTTTPQAFASVNLVSGAAVTIKSLTFISEIETTPVDLELWLFNATFTAPADNAAWTVPDTDILNCVGRIKIPSGDFVLSALNGVASVYNINLVVTPAAQDIYFAIVARGNTPAWTTADGVKLVLGVESD